MMVTISPHETKKPKAVFLAEGGFWFGWNLFGLGGVGVRVVDKPVDFLFKIDAVY